MRESEKKQAIQKGKQGGYRPAVRLGLNTRLEGEGRKIVKNWGRRENGLVCRLKKKRRGGDRSREKKRGPRPEGCAMVGAVASGRKERESWKTQAKKKKRGPTAALFQGSL